MLHVQSPLTQVEEEVVREVIGSAVTVHRAIGPGHLEHTYRRALYLELQARALRYSTEYTTEVRFRGEVVGSHRLDLLVEGIVVVELKAIERLDTVHQQQVVAYLRATGLRIGLLMNFNSAVLKNGLKRIVV
jgi:GxxExxY protein